MGGGDIFQYWMQADAVGRTVVVLLLAMSVASWFAALAKLWTLLRARRHADAALAAFWRAPSIDDGVATLRVQDREGLFARIAAAALEQAAAGGVAGLVDAQVSLADRVLRALREALAESARRLDAGLVLLATVGSTAPFVGLFGTVWGIYHALGSIAAQGQVAIEQVAGPVGEALIMTAFGLAVAIPAVVAYNLCGKLSRELNDRLDGFARDLHGLFGGARATDD